MAIITTKSKFQLALDGVGLILQGTPKFPAYSQDQAPIYGQRFASGDRDYTDFSFWWYWAQTDFSGGIKTDLQWLDDAKFFTSKGVNVEERVGSLTLNFKLGTSNAVAKDMTFKDYGVATAISMLVGRNNTDQKMSIVNVVTGAVVWEDSTTGASEKITCCDGLGNGDLYLGCNTAGSGASTFKKTTGTTPADVGTFAPAVHAMVPYRQGDGIYLFTATNGVYFYSRSAGSQTQITTAYPLGMAYTDLSIGNENGKGAWLIGDKIYFLLKETSVLKTQLWALDIGTGKYTFIYAWGGGSYVPRAIERDGALYCFESNTINSSGLTYVWKYIPSTGVMERILRVGQGGGKALLKGNVARANTNIYFAIDDGTSDYQIWQIDNEDHLFAGISPPAAYATAISMLATFESNNFAVVKNGASGTNKFDSFTSLVDTEKQTTGFLTTSIFDANIPAIDKLFNSVSLNFDSLTSGQSITVAYSLDGGTTFTDVGSVSNTTDGSTIRSKTLYFGSAIVSKTAMLRFTLTGNGGTTAAMLNSFSVRYVPFVEYTKSWSFNVNAATGLKTLDGGLTEKTGRELRSVLERSWFTKSLVDFQDFDYYGSTINNGGTLTASATTITVLSTVDAPEQGRLRCENEEIIYTGKTPTTFTGCVRGARGTIAATHVDTSVINNAYRVIITNLSERIPVALDDKYLEYTIAISIREA